jgi:hypothetical protein
MTENSPVDPPTRIALTVTNEVLERFCLLTGGGFKIRARLGGSVRELLCGQLGVAPAYLDERVQTIFLNGKVVDDPDTATVPAGATIALSAAMPGIAGIMLRRRSPYAPMRSQLSHDDRPSELGAASEGEVLLKLFNLLQPELGPAFLRRGMLIPGRALGELLARRWAAFRAGILAAEVAGEHVAASVLRDTDWTNREVWLQVRSAAEGEAAPSHVTA